MCPARCPVASGGPVCGYYTCTTRLFVVGVSPVLQGVSLHTIYPGACIYDLQPLLCSTQSNQHRGCCCCCSCVTQVCEPLLSSMMMVMMMIQPAYNQTLYYSVSHTPTCTWLPGPRCLVVCRVLGMCVCMFVRWCSGWPCTWWSRGWTKRVCVLGRAGGCQGVCMGQVAAGSSFPAYVCCGSGRRLLLLHCGCSPHTTDCGCHMLRPYQLPVLSLSLLMPSMSLTKKLYLQQLGTDCYYSHFAHKLIRCNETCAGVCGGYRMHGIVLFVVFWQSVSCWWGALQSTLVRNSFAALSHVCACHICLPVWWYVDTMQGVCKLFAGVINCVGDCWCFRCALQVTKNCLWQEYGGARWCNSVTTILTRWWVPPPVSLP